MDNNVQDALIFCGLVMGIKGVPFNTEILLVNNIPDSTLDIIYAVDKVNQTIKIPVSNVKNVSFVSKVRMQNTGKRVESHEMKSALLSAALFGGNPILQMAGAGAINSIFDDLSSNYDKVNFSAYYEMSVEAVVDGIEKEFVFNTDTNPEAFVNQVKGILN